MEKWLQCNKSVFLIKFTVSPPKTVMRSFPFWRVKQEKLPSFHAWYFWIFFIRDSHIIDFLESTLEILQQFFIALEKCDKQYHLSPGNQYQYLVKCLRCHKCVSSTTLGIDDTLLNAPSAMLGHWNILWLTGKFFRHPFLFCSHQLNPTKLQKNLSKNC